MAKKYNCTVNGKPAYRIRLRIGTSIEGKPIYKSFYGDGKIAAEQKRDKYIEKSKKHKNMSITFGALAKTYTYEVMTKSDLAPSSITLYETQYRNRIRDSKICIKPIAELEREDITSLLDKDFPNKTATIKFMKRLFRWLKEEGYCDNYMEGVHANIVHKTEPITIFTEDEVRRILDTPNDLHLLFLLSLSCGLRLGELLALTFSDFRDGTVYISKQVNEYYAVDSGVREYRKVVKPPKSKNSNRLIPLPDSVWEEFIQYKNTHKKRKYLFTTSGGNLIQKGNFHRAWLRHLKRAGVEYKKFHACRATYCTILCRNGVPLETASKLMGHADVSTTAKFYRLVSTDELTNAVKRIDGVFAKESPSRINGDK